MHCAQVEGHDRTNAAVQRLAEVSHDHRASLRSMLSRLWWNLRAHITADQPTRKVQSSADVLWWHKGHMSLMCLIMEVQLGSLNEWDRDRHLLVVLAH